MRAPTLRQLWGEFLRLGALGFGGPQAHLVLQHELAVAQRQWLSEAEFQEAQAFCELLPGPASTQMAIWIGWRLRRWGGGLIAGLAFLLPALGLMLIGSVLYFRWQQLPQLQGVLFGLQPAVLAVLALFCWRQAPRALKTPLTRAIALGALLLTITQTLSLPLQFLLAGLLSLAIAGWRPPLAAWLPFASTSLSAVADPTLLTLFGFCLRTGSLVFGGGLVLVPLMQQAVVHDYGWLTTRQFLDGVALGQLTPGPVTMTATFIGYGAAGLTGALVATLGIYLPSFAFVLLGAPLMDRLRQLAWVPTALRGVTAVVPGAIAAVTLQLAATGLAWDSPLRLSLQGSLLLISLIALGLGRPSWQVLPAIALLGALAQLNGLSLAGF